MDEAITVEEMYTILGQMVIDGKGDLPMVWARGGEDENIYAVQGVSDITFQLTEGGEQNGIQIDLDEYTEVGQMLMMEDGEEG